jgi:hypothetical protein
MLKTLFLSPAILATLVCAPSSWADLINPTAEDPTMFGNLKQGDTNCGNVACGPTAATNSFVWLQNTFPSIYDSSLIPHIGGNTMYQDLQAVADQLSGIMHTCNLCNPDSGGTFIEDFIAGKQSYMGNTVFAAQMNFAWRTTDPDENKLGPKPAFVMDNTKPTAQFIGSEIGAKEDVEIFITGAVDHYLTLTDIMFDTVKKTGSISYIDPDTGMAATSLITGQTADGFLQVKYNGNIENIAHAVAESPVPEPEMFLPLGAGILALTIRRFRRDRFRNDLREMDRPLA